MSQTPEQSAPNAHVHPLMAGILNSHAGLAQQTLHAEFSAVAARVKAAHAAKQPLPALPAIQLETVEQKTDRLLAALHQAECGFDRNYQYSDDYSVYSYHSDKARTIAACRRELAAMGVTL